METGRSSKTQCIHTYAQTRKRTCISHSGALLAARCAQQRAEKRKGQNTGTRNNTEEKEGRQKKRQGRERKRRKEKNRGKKKMKAEVGGEEKQHA